MSVARARRADDEAPLKAGFYARPVVDVARELVGALVVRGDVVLRITEVEAYDHDDSASHARAGVTARTRVMFGRPGHAYVYLCYGLHHMLNVVVDVEGRGAAVLVRAAEVVRGHDVVAARRGGRRGPLVAVGPGNVGQALALDVTWSGRPLFAARPGADDALVVVAGAPPAALLAGPRVGIEFANARDRRRRWRFADAGSAAVTHRRGLTPLRAPRR